MRNWKICAAVCAILFLSTIVTGQTPLGTAFTYQGHLKSNGVAVNNAALPMSFSLFGVASGGNAVAGPIGGNVQVVSGLFTTQLDFGAAPLASGQQRWLEISINGTPLTSRQLLSPAPFARFSAAPWITSGSNISYSGGNVGIGNPTPGTSLDVLGGIRARGGPPGANGASNNGYAFAVGGGDADSGMFSNADGQVEFYTNALERMRITPSSVGIGTNSPSRDLEVQAAGDAEIGVKSSSTNGRLWTIQSTNPATAGSVGQSFQIIDRTAGLGRLLIDTAGKVGIGTTTPTQLLDINGRMNLTGGVIQKGGTAITNTADLGLYSQTEGSWVRFVTTNGNFQWFSDGGPGGAPVMTLTSGGNLGLGVSPSTRLDVSGTAKVTGFQLPTGAGAGKVLTSDAAGVASWQPITVPNNILEFTTPGPTNWTVPAGVTRIVVQIWGAGGSGGGGGAGCSGGGGSGGGGGYARSFLTVTPGQIYQVIVGEGGDGGAPIGQPGSTGGTSSFGVLGGAVLYSSTGGAGGNAGSTPGGAGGAGGSGNPSADVYRSGGAGPSGNGILFLFPSCFSGGGNSGGTPPAGVVPFVGARQSFTLANGTVHDVQHGGLTPVNSGGGSGGSGETGGSSSGQAGEAGYVVIFW